MARIPNFGGFFKADDLAEGPIDLTIKSIEEEEIGQAKESKYVIRFDEDPRGVVMGTAFYEVLKGIFDTADLDAMIGQPVQLFRDPSIMYGGKRVGGVRPRAVPKKKG